MSNQLSDNNKRIAKNTLLLYFRMLFLMVIGLFTSRINLQALGVQDFGIYNSPDELLTEHHQEMSIVKAFAYRHLGRHLMNKNVKRIRDAQV